MGERLTSVFNLPVTYDHDRSIKIRQIQKMNVIEVKHFTCEVAGQFKPFCFSLFLVCFMQIRTSMFIEQEHR